MVSLSHRGLVAFGIVACGCVPNTELGTLPRPPSGASVKVEEKYFDVTGRTVEEIGASLAANASSALGPGIRGQHSWSVRLSYQSRRRPASCKIASLSIRMTSRIVLPQWTEREGADPELVAMWDQYVTALRRHELTHREHAYLAARDLSRGLRGASTAICEDLEMLVASTSWPIFDRYEEHDREFDEETFGEFDWPPQPAARLP